MRSLLKVVSVLVAVAGFSGGVSPLWAQTPYTKLRPLPSFSVTSQNLKNGEAFSLAQISAGLGGKDQSPQLSWSGFPANTKSFTVTVYDMDAPTGSGFWHWAVFNIPATIHSLPAGAGSPDGKLLPPGAIQLPNDARLSQYIGPAPPQGTGTHHYFITVTALDTPSLPLPKTATPAYLGFMVWQHAIARGYLVGTASP